MNRCILFFLQ